MSQSNPQEAMHPTLPQNEYIIGRASPPPTIQTYIPCPLPPTIKQHSNQNDLPYSPQERSGTSSPEICGDSEYIQDAEGDEFRRDSRISMSTASSRDTFGLNLPPDAVQLMNASDAQTLLQLQKG
jgi:hypothetical protein